MLLGERERGRAIVVRVVRGRPIIVVAGVLDTSLQLATKKVLKGTTIR